MDKIMKKIRYDPLYRVIEETDEMRVVEGTFKPMFDRLKRINNLGLIPEVFGMARYPKYEHQLGTIHQVNCLLEIVNNDKIIREKYRMPLQLSSIFLHTGHLPYTYSTERSLLLASNLGKKSDDNNVRKYIIEKVNKVLIKVGYEEEEQQEVLENLFSMEDYKKLYRYFSSENIINKWSTLKKKLQNLEDNQLEIIVKNLIDTESHGYKYLNLADKADYVQRDALYFGAVKIDVSPQHLYREASMYNPKFSVSEEKLIESNLEYLNERFYEHENVLFFSRLYEKILASLIISKSFDKKWLENYTDDQFKRLITENIDATNDKVKLPPVWVKKAKDLFENKVSYTNILHLKVPFQKEKTSIDVEYELIKKRRSDRGLLLYPYETGILVTIDYIKLEDLFVHPNSRLYSIHVFQDDSNKQLVELLKIIDHLSYHLAIHDIEIIRRNIGEEFSWTKKIRYDNRAIISAIVEAILKLETDKYKEGEFVEKYLQALYNISTYKELWNNFQNQFIWKEQIVYFIKEHKGEDSKSEMYEYFVRGLLDLPVKLLQYQSTKKYIQDIYNTLLTSIPQEDSNEKKGNLFEALWLIKKLQIEKGDFQLFFNGMVVVDLEKPKEEQDENEFDVIELIINKEGKAECWIYACSIADNYRQKNQEQITKLTDYIHQVFSDAIINTRYVIPMDKNNQNWSPREIDAGRNFGG
ncbi:hypothetical protein MSKOL_2625 [Methanosarcina sp. Kolksee]|uniref:hypothetical protein n=1 Tax=Methanosarcina sp. Kolksee TaxID=1434099 RepID=UPI000615E750|nr:hypothetical protein [Methanosarcina sp. Kolksee]AKB48402.1 hypothetical protein MSKOL_2625 [Methanosarcina sp. Kolksee]